MSLGLGLPTPGSLRARPDLMVAEQSSGTEKRWAIKDPVGLEYFHFGPEEWYLFRLLDGNTPLEEIKQRFEKELYPRRISTAELEAFCLHLHENGLVLSDGTGQGSVLRERADRKRTLGIGQTLLGPLSIRLPGVNPTWLLDVLGPVGLLLFHRLFVMIVGCSCVAAVALLVSQFETVAGRMPSMQEFLTGSNLVLFLVALVIAKSLHELGHALACRHFGGECHEIGVMFLAFMPCLYSDVTDSWMFPRRWHRIAVALAGVYLELIVASACVFIWYFSEPGVTQSIAFNLILVCSLGTIAFNGNPLMHYDGYFVLSDVWRVPNLAEQSTWVLRNVADRFLFSGKSRPYPLSANAWLLGLYGIAAAVYRLFVVTVILWGTYRFLKHIQLAAVGDVLVLVTLGGLMLPTLTMAVSFARQPTIGRKIRWGRFALCVVFAAVVMRAVWLYPFPHSVHAPFVVELKEARPVFAQASGELVACSTEGTTVQAGETIAQLREQIQQLEIIRVHGEVEGLRHDLESARKRMNNDRSLSAQIPTIEAALNEREEALRLARRDRDRLVVRSPRTGMVVPVLNSRVNHRDESDDMRVHARDGSPLDPENFSCRIEAGDLICMVGDPTQLQATLLVAQESVEDIREGASVELWLDQVPHRPLEGVVRQISRGNQAALEYRDGMTPTEPQRLGEDDEAYRVRVEFESEWSPGLPQSVGGDAQTSRTQQLATHGSRGRAIVHTGTTTLAQLCKRYLNHTFRFEL